jgi:RNA polymerase sigma-70 factor (ECF subfamily)
VVEAFGPALWRLTAGYASDHASREDLHQEILLGVWKALPRFRGESSVATFIFRIGHNRGITHRARRKAREWREVDVEPSIADHRPPADALLQIEERRNALLLAVRALPPTLAQTVMLHLEGLSAREIGEVLGITENNAAVRLTRARNTLRETLSRGPT